MSSNHKVSEPSQAVITVDGIGKQYRIGTQLRQTSIRDSISEFLTRSNGAGNNSKHTAFWALKDISFSISLGEVVGIIGHNGSGKSTLLKILSRIVEPTEGKVVLRGKVASLLEVGTGFNPELTGRENVYLNGAILGMKRKEIARKFKDIVDFAGVEKFIDTPVKRYSSGMYVRLAFSVAAHLDSDILLVDEVLAVGDTEFQEKCLNKMNSLAHDGRTVLFVSHDLNAIKNLCQTCILLDSGYLTYFGPSSEAINHYLTNSKQELIGGKFDYSKIADRRGTGLIKIDKVYFEDESGNLITSVGQLTACSVVIETLAEDKLPGILDVGISLSDNVGNLLIHSYLSDRKIKPQLSNKRMVFRYSFPQMLLYPGKYMVGSRLLYNGEEADWPRSNLAILTVNSSSEIAYRPDRQQPLLSMNGQWQVNKA